MSIYILDEDLSRSVQLLDDDFLKKQIKDIIQCLCDVNHVLNDNIPPIKSNYIFGNMSLYCRWVSWALTRRINYLTLCDLLRLSLEEIECRFYSLRGLLPRVDYQYRKAHLKLLDLHRWCYSNVPSKLNNDFEGVPVFFEIILPKPFHFSSLQVSYRAYYDHRLSEKVKCRYCNATGKVKKKKKCDKCGGVTFLLKYNPTWTCRTKPEWLD